MNFAAVRLGRSPHRAPGSPGVVEQPLVLVADDAIALAGDRFESDVVGHGEEPHGCRR
jgi:hypothetical protein